MPLHYVSKFIGDTDPFGTLVDGARKLGMHVMARVDPHAIHQDAADAHPEWIAVDKDGNKRRHWALPDVWVTCAYSDYNFKFMPEVLEEITREYDIDAIFANRWQGHGVCYCDSCKTQLQGRLGLRSAARARSRESGLAGLDRLAPGRADPARRRVGRGDEGDQAAHELHPQHGRRLAHGVRPVA